MANRTRLILAVGLIVIAGILLMIVNSGSSSSYYITIKELQEKDSSKTTGERYTVKGVVKGDSIVYDTGTAKTTFTLVDITDDQTEISDHDDGLEGIIADALARPGVTMNVVYENVKPDMLKHGVQALVRGYYQADGTFLADEIILQCPSKYVAMPEQALPEEVEE